MSTDTAKLLKSLFENENPILVIDTETTGVGPDDELVEIVVVRSDREILLDQLVKPTIPIPVSASQIHGIYDQDVANAPTLADIWPQLCEITQDQIIWAYNADFDERLIRQSAAKFGLGSLREQAWHCAMKSYAQFSGRTHPYIKLVRACDEMGVLLNGAHRAANDALATLDLLRAIANRIP